MKSKAILVSLLAICAVFAFAIVSGTSTPNGNLNAVLTTTVNGADLDLGSGATLDLSSDVGTMIPVKVQITNNENFTLTDARIKVEIRNADVEAETDQFILLSGKTKTEFLSLQLPQSIKDNPSKDYRLVVTLTSNEGDFQMVYDPFSVDRKPYDLEVLSVDTSGDVSAGSNLAVNVVLKNIGAEDLSDTFVTVRIPALNVEKRVYFSDLAPVDGREITLDQSDITDQSIVVHETSDRQSSAERTLYLQIPSDAKAGVYSLEVEASNADTDTKTTKSITIMGSEQSSDVLASSISKDVEAGQTVTYDLVLVNSGDKIAVYDIVPENAQNLVVSVDEPVVTVQAGSSKTVQVKATAGDVMGTFNFAVNVNSQGNLVKRVNLTANVSKKTVTSNVMVLTVVLAIIFVVLLIVLIVLLTRKPEKTEEVGESYY